MAKAFFRNCFYKLSRNACVPSHIRFIVALLPLGRISPCFVTRFCSLHPPPAALATLPLARTGASQGSTSPNQKGHLLVKTISFKRFFINCLGTHSVPSHIQNIVALLPFGRISPYFVTRFCSLHPPPAALATLPLARAGASQGSTSPKQKGHLLVSFLFWRRRRDLNSRAVIHDLHP